MHQAPAGRRGQLCFQQPCTTWSGVVGRSCARGAVDGVEGEVFGGSTWGLMVLLSNSESKHLGGEVTEARGDLQILVTQRADRNI